MNDAKHTSIEKLQGIELNIAKEFASICDSHGLIYYMLGGTMLGAIRHKGFIPWDDDMDFALPRGDYEKFLEIAPKELPSNMKLASFKNTPNYKVYPSEIWDLETKVIDRRVEGADNTTHATIDIFPIDGSPNIYIFRQIYFVRVLYHRAMLTLCSKDSIDRKKKRSTAEKCLLFVLEKLPIEKFTTTYKQDCKIDKLMKRQIIDNSNYVGNIMGAYRTKEVVPVEFYGKGRMYPFEDTEFRGLTMYDEYLTWLYGDYMKMPSREDIDRKTHYKILELHGEKLNG